MLPKLPDQGLFPTKKGHLMWYLHVVSGRGGGGGGGGRYMLVVNRDVLQFQ